MLLMVVESQYSSHWHSSKSEPAPLFELQCSCQSARQLDLHRPGSEDDNVDIDVDNVDDDDDNDGVDDLDMHPETSHDSIASAQTPLGKLCLMDFRCEQ